MVYERDMGWIFVIMMVLFFTTSGFGFLDFEEPESYGDVENFEELYDVVNSIEELQDLKNKYKDDLKDANKRIKHLENTDWYTKYYFARDELDAERSNNPSLILISYATGLLAFVIVFVFTWFYRSKQYSDLKNDKKILSDMNKILKDKTERLVENIEKLKKKK